MPPFNVTTVLVSQHSMLLALKKQVFYSNRLAKELMEMVLLLMLRTLARIQEVEELPEKKNLRKIRTRRLRKKF